MTDYRNAKRQKRYCNIDSSMTFNGFAWRNVV